MNLNNTFLLAYWRRPDLEPWDIAAEDGTSFPGALYTARTLLALDRRLGRKDLTFVATDSVREVAAEGDSVVVLLREDEWCRIPRYAARVRAVFKSYGTTLRWGANPLVHPSPQALLSSVQDVRTELARLPTRVRALGRPRVYDVPLGYYRQLERPPVPIVERRHDLYFGGSIVSTRALSSRWFAAVGTPKNRSRRLLLDALRRLRTERPGLRIDSHLTQSFASVEADEVRTYSDTMAETKICVVPRGQNLETYRLFEGLRSGCAVVAETLPSRWFYDDAPIERVGSWDELESVVLRLLGDGAALERRQRESLAWWRDVCSEDAVAAYMEHTLGTIDANEPALG